MAASPLPDSFSLGDAADAVSARLQALRAARFAERLWQRDPTLWGDDSETQAVARRRLGWLASPAAMREAASELADFATEVRRDGYRRVVLLGMGGSSLAPEVLARTFGVPSGGLELIVLDSTSPAAVREVTANADPADTLFVVGSKSGTTIEVTSFERHFWARAQAALTSRAGRGFVAITDPGTPLERLAADRGYRRVFRNSADIGGRYSALSYFGLVPAALLGVDLRALLDHARAEEDASRGVPGNRSVPNGFTLGAALGELARRGRDKLTLLLGPDLAPFGDWIEQLVAESTGKDGLGILPVVGEPVGPPETYGGDRVFVAFSAEPQSDDHQRALDALAAAGHPVLRWRDPEPAALGAEFLRWEIATVTAAAILGVDPFDEPNVTEAKEATRAVLARERTPAEPHGLDAPEIQVQVPELLLREMPVDAGSDPGAWVAALLAQARPGDYLAILAFLHRTPEVHERLEAVRHIARGPARLATTLGYGPRFLHSTGQFHKGGPGIGIFLQLTADEGADVAIPGESFGFQSLIRAQAAGDYEVLERRGRRLIHVHLGARPLEVLDRIAETLAALRV